MSGSFPTSAAKASRTLSIVVPVYYNAESLPLLFNKLRWLEQRLDELGIGLEIIFVNDGSGDNSLAALLQIKSERPLTKVISLSRNFGAHAASKTGFQFVTGDAFLILAADLQDPVEQVLKMTEEWVKGAKYVISVRAAREDSTSVRFFARSYYRMLNWMVVKGYPQGGFDLMLMDRVMLPYMKNSVKHTNHTVYSLWLGFPPTVLSYVRRERMHGRSRYTLKKKVKFLLDTFTGFSAVPMRMLSGFGVLVAILSFLYGLSIVVTTLIGGAPVRGFATLAVLIIFFSGLILIMLGTLGEYLWRVFDAVSNKPESVIDEIYL
jgi:polyisoprenyl-phosphate glycosyltransferase